MAAPLPSDFFKEQKEEYMKTIPRKISDLQKAIENLGVSYNEETISALRLLVHRLAGSAGTYGFSEVSVICKGWEKEILELMERKALPSPKERMQMRGYLQKIEEAFRG